MGTMLSIAQGALNAAWSGVARLRGDGGPARLRAASAYEAAGQGRRNYGWFGTGQSVNSILSASGDELRRRSRDAVRQNPLAEEVLDKYVSNAIGTGIRPQFKHPDARMRVTLGDVWARFCDEADADGVQDFYGLQALAMRSAIEAGEVLGRFRPRLASDGLYVPLQIQLLEGEMMPLTETFPAGVSPKALPGNAVRCGVEFEPHGRRTAYHVYATHPGDSPLFQSDGIMTRRVPAEQMLHLFKQLRPGQVRGIPWLANVLIRLRDLDKYTDAVLLRNQLQAMFSGFITENIAEGASPLLPAGGKTDSDGVEVAKLEPGTFLKLRPGEEVDFPDISELGAGHKEFVDGYKRDIASGGGVTFEQLTGDLTGVNYSSIRAGLIEFRRECRQTQAMTVVHQFCKPTLRQVVIAAAMAGHLPARDVAENLYLFTDAKWVPEGWEETDREKEERANHLALRDGTTSRRRVVAEKGIDIEELDEEIRQDNERADALGLKFDSDGRRQAAVGGGGGAGQAGGGGASNVPADEGATGTDRRNEEAA